LEYTLKLGKFSPKYPVLQGGMGVGISLSNLAAAVSNAGGVGVISGIQLGFRESDFWTNSLNANIEGIRKEIRRARELAKGGILGINFLTAMTQYTELVKTAVEEKIDFIISGAGLPLELPSLIKGSDTLGIPIISSPKALRILLSRWLKKDSYIPPAVIVEGPKAGGHLGFTNEELKNEPDIFRLIKDVKAELSLFEEANNCKISLIAAGGIFDGDDVKKAMENGADGVQVGSRFAATVESDADIKLKELYVNSESDEIMIIQSPVGMPGRAIKTEHLVKLEKMGRIPIKRCMRCLKTCDPKTTPYCISEALVKAAEGDLNEGLFFAGSNVSKIKEIQTVEEVMKDLVSKL